MRPSGIPRIALLCMIVCVAGLAGAPPARAFHAEPSETMHHVQLYTPFNGRDVALGLEYSIEPLAPSRVALFAAFAVRPYHKKVLDRVRPHFAFVYNELLYHGAAGLSTSVPIAGPVWAQVGAGAAYVFGDYAGTSQPPHDKWTPLLRGGIICSPHESPVFLQASYQYADLRSGGSSWALLSVGVRF